MRPRIGISDRLLSATDRFDGGRPRHRFLADDLDAHVEWVPYSAELEVGLGALWETWRLTGQSRLFEVGDSDLAGLPTPSGLDGYVAKADPRGPGAFNTVFAQRLSSAYPLLPVADDDMLDDAAPRARFVERVFAAARLRELFTPNWRARDLVAFHTRHKAQMLAHDPKRYREAGRVVARTGDRPRDETEADYRRIFAETLASVATRGRNANAMQHVFGMISDRLDDRRRRAMLDRIDAYQRGELPFGIPIVLLTRHVANERMSWAAEQTYLNPVPRDLRRHLWTLEAGKPYAGA